MVQIKPPLLKGGGNGNAVDGGIGTNPPCDFVAFPPLTRGALGESADFAAIFSISTTS